MGKKLSEEIVESDSDESMHDAPETQPNEDEKKTQSKSSSNEEISSSSSESGSGDESSDESSSEENVDKSSSSSSSNKKKSFVPPSGFRFSKPKTRPSAAISSALSNLEGKQVFHITAPSNLPITQIQQIDFGKVMSGKPILSHKGVDYSLIAHSEQQQQQQQGSNTLLVYDEDTNTFLKKQGLKNIQSYNIQELVQLPGLNSLEPVNITQEATKKQPASRPQPKHLKMRFHPVGSKTLPPETVGSSSESEAEEPTFRVPPTTTSVKEKKRKSDDPEVSGEKAKKTKKEKTVSQVEAETEGGRRDKEKKKSSKNREETSQERRARKEEKKKRKGEKGQ